MDGWLKCARCGQDKPVGSFSVDKARKTGRHAYCKRCKAAYMKIWNREHPESRQRHDLRKSLRASGATEEWLAQQPEGCAICGVVENVGGRSRLSIDHNHETNKPRGLLCGNCNMALGGFKDNIQTLRNAIRYLEEES